MAASRVLLLASVLGIAGGIVWLVVRDRRPDVASVSSGSSAGVGKAAIAAPEGPSLGASGGGAPTGGSAAASPSPPPPAAGGPGSAAVIAPEVPTGPSPKDVFATQTRDPTWAGPTESEIRKRLGALAVPLDRVECRHDRCELTVAGDPDAVSAAVASLEKPAGLIGYAQSVLLTAPEVQQGRMTLRVYATFARAPGE